MPFHCFCEFKDEWDRKGSDEFWTYYGAPPESDVWDIPNMDTCCDECEKAKKEFL